MNGPEQYYQILGLKPGASEEEVKQAYRDLAKVWHPDRFSQEDARFQRKAEEKLKEINEAYTQVLAYTVHPGASNSQSNRKKGAGSSSPQQTAHGFGQANKRSDSTYQAGNVSRPPSRFFLKFIIPVLFLGIFILLRTITPNRQIPQPPQIPLKESGSKMASEEYFQNLLELSDQVSGRNPVSSPQYLRNGIAYYEKGQYQLAIWYLDRVLEINPNDTEARLYRDLAFSSRELERK